MKPKIAVNTDYLEDTKNPEPYLQKISQAGFTHIMWCHHWNDDFMYSDAEINKISGWLNKYQLQLIHIHASHGKKKKWISCKEHERCAGIELIKNRISMAAKLSCNMITIHLEHEPGEGNEEKYYWDLLHKTLDELKIFAKKHKVKIALENLFKFDIECIQIKRLFSEYEADFLGFCYDTGHENIVGGFKSLELFKNRLIAIHLHDNQGQIDEHNHIFSGIIDWQQVAGFIAQSTYNQCMCIEINAKKSKAKDEVDFLKKGYEAGIKFSEMVNKLR